MPASPWEREGSRREGGNCLFAGHFGIFTSTWEFTSEPLVQLSTPLVIICSMCWENNWIRRTSIFVGKLCPVFHKVWLVHVQPVPWISGGGEFPTSVGLNLRPLRVPSGVCSPDVCWEIASKGFWGQERPRLCVMCGWYWRNLQFWLWSHFV